MRKSPFFQKWFVGNIFTKKVEETTKEESKEEVITKETEKN